jgi:hypothetical protein
MLTVENEGKFSYAWNLEILCRDVRKLFFYLLNINVKD